MASELIRKRAPVFYPTPVSGFRQRHYTRPVRYPAEFSHGGEHDPLRWAWSQVWSLDSVYASQIYRVTNAPGQPRNYEFQDLPYTRKWDHHSNVACLYWSREERRRLFNLLFRLPFDQEQPRLGFLMVHPNVKRQRFQDTVGRTVTQLWGHILYPDVMNLVLDFAFTDSDFVADFAPLPTRTHTRTRHTKDGTQASLVIQEVLELDPRVHPAGHRSLSAEEERQASPGSDQLGQQHPGAGHQGQDPHGQRSQ